MQPARDGYEYGFTLAAYDPRHPLIIDPVLLYSTYLGGSGNDKSYAIAVDGAGCAYVTGCTDSTNFPTRHPYQADQGAYDTFVTKLGPEAPIKTEQWELILDGGQGSGNCTLIEHHDGTVTADGDWIYTYQGADVSGPYSDAPVTIAGSSISITASGIATNPSAPSGYKTSPFTFSITGTAYNGHGSGPYTMTFTTYGWPPSLSGSWEGTRTSGSGITAPQAKAMPWIPLLLLDD